MSVTVTRLRNGFFLDSVALMRISSAVARLEGVEEAALMMGTPANLEILRDAGLLSDTAPAATGGDLVVGVRAASAAAADAAHAAAEALLAQPRHGGGAAARHWQPRSLRTALEALPDANLALISVPGDYAAGEAHKALARGLNVMIFSDNVALADEIALKQAAAERGLLVMGPDCGTAILGGVPLAFANQVAAGDVGIVGASGTGIQEVSTLIARAGGGISHAIGVGGRDLSQAVGGLSTLAALDLLDADPHTRHVVLISKPPAAAVAERIVARVARSEKTFTVCFLGAAQVPLPGNARFAATLQAAAESALGRALAPAVPQPRALRAPRIEGLFAGGTLAAEAQLILLAGGEAVASNAPVPGAVAAGEGASHRVMDLGADEYTRGRPHPMIDPSVRDAPLRRALADDQVGLVLLDVVLGHGAVADPAGHLAAVLDAAGGGGPLVVASVTGTEGDPQVRSRQVAALQGAGAVVAASNAEAAGFALACLRLTG